MTGPLTGIRVLDLTRVIMGPYATQLLADQGAEVIVVESEAGDVNRALGGGPHEELSGMSLNLMRGKQSIVLDLTTDAGRQTVRDLAATCDVVVASMRPQALRALGIDDAAIRAVNPEVVYCQAQGWPLGGDRAEEPAYDDIVQAASGLADLAARTGGEPALLPTVIADKVCGLFMAQAISAALVHRARTGEGQHIEVPMVPAMTSFLLVEHGAAAVSEPRMAEAGYARVLGDRQPCRTRDGWAVVLPYLPKHFAALFAAVGRDDLVADPRIATRRAAVGHAAALQGEVRAIAATMTTAELLALCAAQGVPASTVATLDELVEDLPIASHAVAGDYRQLPHPARFSRTPAGAGDAPLVGADGERVRAALAAWRGQE